LACWFQPYAGACWATSTSVASGQTVHQVGAAFPTHYTLSPLGNGTNSTATLFHQCAALVAPCIGGSCAWPRCVVRLHASSSHHAPHLPRTAGRARRLFMDNKKANKPSWTGRVRLNSAAQERRRLNSVAQERRRKDCVGATQVQIRRHGTSSMKCNCLRVPFRLSSCVKGSCILHLIRPRFNSR
jgi:hypothetical protein